MREPRSSQRQPLRTFHRTLGCMIAALVTIVLGSPVLAGTSSSNTPAVASEAAPEGAAAGDTTPDNASTDSPSESAPLILPPARPATTAASEGVHWGPLLSQSLLFLGVQHGFRFATEAGTREGMRGPFFKGWYDSLSALHGWGDGDPFYVNYVGHPLQGAVSGFLFQANDPKYRAIEFGNNRDYWKSRLRAAAFSFAYSTQFEIGPLSEASFGKVQSTYPQQGFVDHVATPTVGTLWMVSEDILDRYVIRSIEGRTENPWVRMLARGWLNPGRSFSNMMQLRAPWVRDSRPGVWSYKASEERLRRHREKEAAQYRLDVPAASAEAPWKVLAPFEFGINTRYSIHPNGGSGLNCIGGGATAVWNVSPVYSWVADVGGCKLFTFDPALSGDILNYRVGSRWSRRGGRIVPYGQVLVGGKRATVEKIPEEYRETVREMERLPRERRPSRWDYIDRQQSNGFTLSVGGGIDMPIKPALSLRLASFDYSHAWLPSAGHAFYPDSFQFSTGLALRVGTW